MILFFTADIFAQFTVGKSQVLLCDILALTMVFEETMTVWHRDGTHYTRAVKLKNVIHPSFILLFAPVLLLPRHIKMSVTEVWRVQATAKKHKFNEIEKKKSISSYGHFSLWVWTMLHWHSARTNCLLPTFSSSYMYQVKMNSYELCFWPMASSIFPLCITHEHLSSSHDGTWLDTRANCCAVSHCHSARTPGTPVNGITNTFAFYSIISQNVADPDNENPICLM